MPKVRYEYIGPKNCTILTDRAALKDESAVCIRSMALACSTALHSLLMPLIGANGIGEATVCAFAEGYGIGCRLFPQEIRR